MFVNKMSRIIAVKHNLSFPVTKCEYSFYYYNHSFHIKNVKFLNIQKHFLNLKERFKKNLSKSRNIKDYSNCLISLWTRQCEFVIAQRIRRGQQMFSLYSKLWEEHAFKEILKRMRQQVLRRGRNLVLGTAGISAYAWNDNIIKDTEIFKHFEEISVAKKMRDTQLTCSVCKNRLVIDKPLPNLVYCKCPNRPHTVKQKYQSSPIPKGQWEPFIERNNIIIWRKELYPGKFAFKMLGMYKHICPNDYLDVQINLPYRKKWDDTAVELKVIDSHSKTQSDIVYWEMKWPRFFSNRDYVFNRRYYVDKENKVIVLICKNTEHPACPPKNTTIRVNEYWSILVIRPISVNTDLSQPGCEFSLTYFDDPGMTIPETMTTWIAISGMPDFMDKLHKAAKSYKRYLRSIGGLKDKKSYKLPEEHATSADDEGIEIFIDKIPPEQDGLSKNPKKESSDIETKLVAIPVEDLDDYEQIDPLEPQKDYGNSIESTVDDSFWRYLRPSYFFY